MHKNSRLSVYQVMVSIYYHSYLSVYHGYHSKISYNLCNRILYHGYY